MMQKESERKTWNGLKEKQMLWFELHSDCLERKKISR